MDSGAKVDVTRLSDTGAVLDAATSADGVRMATCSADGSVCAWHRSNLEQQWQETSRWQLDSGLPEKVASRAVHPTAQTPRPLLQ